MADKSFVTKFASSQAPFSAKFNQNGGGGGGSSDTIWLPSVSEEGIISWIRSSSTTPPAARDIKGPQGDPGQPGTPGTDGVGIVSIEKTSTVGNVDTYTITLSNESTYEFTVTNGSGESAVSVTGTLQAGQTSITLENAAITTNGTFDFYTTAYGVNPTSATVSTGSITLTFEAQQADLGVKVVIR